MLPRCLILLCLSCSSLLAQEELVYVKKETRELSRKASLEASGQAVWPGECP